MMAEHFPSKQPYYLKSAHTILYLIVFNYLTFPVSFLVLLGSL